MPPPNNKQTKPEQTNKQRNIQKQINHEKKSEQARKNPFLKRNAAPSKLHTNQSRKTWRKTKTAQTVILAKQ